ncbi:MAG TPA: EutN/CcmL family microcompartment protein [Pseudomonadota bacterium]|nr:EutN/CcmL family microcompartment protein [Pseudomonadota bacterium]
MKRGVLIGEVWATRKAAGLASKSLKLVLESPSLSEPGALYAPITVAIDTLDGKLGQPVLVAYGSGARNVMAKGASNRAVLADAAVAVLLDGTEPSAANDDPAQAPKKE